jgi:hypothetical protein
MAPPMISALCYVHERNAYRPTQTDKPEMTVNYDLIR